VEDDAEIEEVGCWDEEHGEVLFFAGHEPNGAEQARTAARQAKVDRTAAAEVEAAAAAAAEAAAAEADAMAAAEAAAEEAAVAATAEAERAAAVMRKVEEEAAVRQAEADEAAAALAAGATAGPEELRIDVADGRPYSQAEFVDQYGGTTEWHRSPPYATKSIRRSPPPPPPVETSGNESRALDPTQPPVSPAPPLTIA
jgi:hypothetical protein